MIPGPDGSLEVLVTGRGDPTTVFAHGLAGSIDETRPFGSGVLGTKVFFHFRGHGASSGSEHPWTYAAAADDLRAVMHACSARRAVGVSLGSGAILRLAVVDPDAFDRMVLVLPATIDRARLDPAVELMQARADLVDHRDLDGLAASLVAEQPVGVRDRPDVRLWAERQARRLSSTTVARALRELPPQHPLDSRDQLATVKCPVLLIAQEGDAAHPAAIARELAAQLPRSDLQVYDDGGVLWSHRAEVRRRISTFLNSPS